MLLVWKILYYMDLEIMYIVHFQNGINHISLHLTVFKCDILFTNKD